MKRQLENEKLKMDVFKTPQGYFEKLTEAIQNRQNLAAWQTQPDKFATNHYFRVPANYFGQLPQRIWARIEQLKQVSATQQNVWEKGLTWIEAIYQQKRVAKWALASLLLLISSSLSLYFWLENEQQLLTTAPSFVQKWSQSLTAIQPLKADLNSAQTPVQNPSVVTLQAAVIPPNSIEPIRTSNPTDLAQNIEAMPPTLDTQVSAQVEAADILAELTPNDIWAYLQEEELSAQDAFDYWLNSSSLVSNDHWEVVEIETITDYLKSREFEEGFDFE